MNRTSKSCKFFTVHWINLLFSIKGFDDNGKNGLDRHFSKSGQKKRAEAGKSGQEWASADWKLDGIHDSWMTLSRKNPTPEGDGGNCFYVVLERKIFHQIDQLC